METSKATVDKEVAAKEEAPEAAATGIKRRHKRSRSQSMTQEVDFDDIKDVTQVVV